MIRLYGTEAQCLQTFKTYESLCDYLKRHEKILCSYLTDEESEENKWDFIYHPYKRVVHLAQAFNRQLTACEHEALNTESGIVEIYTGDIFYPRQYPVTEDFDMEAVMREWCFQYAFTHGYRVFELISNDPISSKSLSPNIKAKSPSYNFSSKNFSYERPL